MGGKLHATGSDGGSATDRRLTVREIRDVEASGAARIEMSHIDAAELVVRLSGAVSASAGGLAGQLTLAVGCQSLDRQRAPEPERDRHVSGASYGVVRASDSLQADVNGVSVLEYVGDPRVVSRVDGLSVLRRVGP